MDEKLLDFDQADSSIIISQANKIFFISYHFFTWKCLTYDHGSFKSTKKLTFANFFWELKFILQKVKYIQVVNFLFLKKECDKGLERKGKINRILWILTFKEGKITHGE